MFFQVAVSALGSVSLFNQIENVLKETTDCPNKNDLGHLFSDLKTVFDVADMPYVADIHEEEHPVQSKEWDSVHDLQNEEIWVIFSIEIENHPLLLPAWEVWVQEMAHTVHAIVSWD